MLIASNMLPCAAEEGRPTRPVLGSRWYQPACVGNSTKSRFNMLVTTIQDASRAMMLMKHVNVQRGQERRREEKRGEERRREEKRREERFTIHYLITPKKGSVSE